MVSKILLLIVERYWCSYGGWDRDHPSHWREDPDPNAAAFFCKCFVCDHFNWRLSTVCIPLLSSWIPAPYTHFPLPQFPLPAPLSLPILASLLGTSTLMRIYVSFAHSGLELFSLIHIRPHPSAMLLIKSVDFNKRMNLLCTISSTIRRWAYPRVLGIFVFSRLLFFCGQL